MDCIRICVHSNDALKTKSLNEKGDFVYRLPP